MQFMARAAEHGLPISKPWGETSSFDFVVGMPRHFASVQVKSTTCRFKGGYVCTVRGGGVRYVAGSFDFLVVYVVPEELWYIIPAAIVQGKDRLAFFPRSKKAKYGRYQEAWHLLREAAGSGERSEDPRLATPGRSGGAGGEEMPVAESAESGAEQAAGAAPKYPENVLGRVRASMEFARRQLGLARPEGQDEDG